MESFVLLRSRRCALANMPFRTVVMDNPCHGWKSHEQVFSTHLAKIDIGFKWTLLIQLHILPSPAEEEADKWPDKNSRKFNSLPDSRSHDV